MNKAIVIIPTIGAHELELAVSSVLDQTVKTDVLVVFDGVQYERDLKIPCDKRIHKLSLPFNTGSFRTAGIDKNLPRHWYGARAMIAAAYAVNNDYSMILDQDNWLRSDHVESCIEKLNAHSKNETAVVYSLRNIFRKDATFVCRDDCESLGKQVGVSGYLIDTSCYFYRTDFLMQTAHWWLSGWGSDRVYLGRLMKNYGQDSLAGTGLYTVNYRLGGNEGSVKEQFFLMGNQKNEERFKKPFPWSKE